MLRAIREIQPAWVVGENVRGLTNWNGGMVFDEVQAEMEAEGYEVTPFLLPACAVNAPHRRDRIWFVANSSSKRQSGQGRAERQLSSKENEDWKKYRVVDDGGWPTVSPLCSRNDGLSKELDGITFSKWSVESIKGGGNSIVPQVALQIFKAIEQYENNR